ncbi:MAG: type IX secretion system outer membrane channel protein PorV [Putridiphycobacter sp.]
MKKIFYSILGLGVSIGANAQNVTPNQTEKADQIQLNTITTAMPFLIITPDSRAGGIGDAGAATSADVNSLYWNTAKLAFSDQKTEVGVSYSPWLRQLVDDIHLSYLSGYHKLSKRHVIGGSLRYFSLGNIVFTDHIGNVTREFNPNEFELLGGYAFKLSDYFSVGMNGKFAYSNLTGGVNVGSVASKAAVAGGVDLSMQYFNDELDLGKYDATWSAGLTINNIGNKVSYTNSSTRDFLPTNLRLGTAYKIAFDDYNALTTTIDFNKLLVPTTPFRDPNNTENIISGKNNDVGVIAGILQSFYDAPGIVTDDGNGNYEVTKGSKFREELREINIGGGLEYWYGSLLAVRAGFFHEHASKGNRKYLTFGAGLYYSKFGIDISYLASVTQNNPLANTVRFSLSFKFTEAKVSDVPSVD